MKADGIATLIVLLILGALILLLQASITSVGQLYQLALFRKKHHQAFWYAKGLLKYGHQVIKNYRPTLDEALKQKHEIKGLINPWPLDNNLQAVLSITKKADQYVLTSQIIQKHKIIFSLQERVRIRKGDKTIESFAIATL